MLCPCPTRRGTCSGALRSALLRRVHLPEGFLVQLWRCQRCPGDPKAPVSLHSQGDMPCSRELPVPTAETQNRGKRELCNNLSGRCRNSIHTPQSFVGLEIHHCVSELQDIFAVKINAVQNFYFYFIFFFLSFWPSVSRSVVCPFPLLVLL